ncbi:unnamed protein product [Ceutorhynchus assimilis]|uniref:Acyltransferase 3 domain-containing protein n=1 Tax=Ceutorhynchus assimilis TaxID=467358 RepID=A0A9N9MK52_9CUCU|nr:unnamed protein product [Ceutorhynchus assimilis]
MLILFLIYFAIITAINAEITGKQYASIPELFYQDNYDNCMMREDEAFYCSLTYKLEPVDKEYPPDVWINIKNISDIHVNYRHDHLRRWICVPKTCPGINKTQEDDPELQKSLEMCYNKKFKKFGLKGTVSDIKCDTIEPKYPFDWVDAFAMFLAISYILFVAYATIYEGIARYQTPDEYRKRLSTPMGMVLGACSITKNWIRLKTIKNTPEIEKLRCIQGIRVYNTILVILTHTILGFVAAPVANTRYTETMPEKYARVFFASGPLCVSTFFLISSFLLTNGLFEYQKDKRMSFKMVFMVFANRLFRLTPTVFTIVLFHATLLRFLGSGPNWYHFIGAEYLKCRANGWSNLLYINNWVDTHRMCLPITWYLALDTQYFLGLLFFIWFIKSNEKYVYHIIGAALMCNMVGTFFQNYYYDFTALSYPTAEMYYGMDQFLSSNQFHYQLGSAIGNTAGPIVGTAFGYYFFKHKFDEKPFFRTKFRIAMWWIVTWGVAIPFVIIPGFIILNASTEKNIFWASVYVAVSRPLFAFVIGTGIIGFTQGVGWLCVHVCQWPPTYVLGRLTFSAYLVHMSIILIRPSLARYPLHLSDFQMLVGFLGDISIVYLIATFITLFLELPVSELQKFIFGPKETKQKTEEKENSEKTE